jgi:4-hydroxy-3-methylbut-2-enyl diphosphate reductase
LRLRELAEECGVAAHLIDGPADIPPEWLFERQTVLVTAGASAPESVVRQCVQHLVDTCGATVEHRTLHNEDVYFPLPRDLRPFVKQP